jgi:hypothetical protein
VNGDRVRGWTRATTSVTGSTARAEKEGKGNREAEDRESFGHDASPLSDGSTLRVERQKTVNGH